MVDKEGNLYQTEPFTEGSHCSRSGKSENTTQVCVTYNYAWFFYKFMDNEKGIEAIYGLTGKETLPMIRKMLDELCSKGMGNGEHISVKDDYWLPTPLNVSNILRLLESWCIKFPEGTFRGD